MLGRHDEGSITLLEGTLNQEKEEWELAYSEQTQQFTFKCQERLNFIMFLRNLCGGKIFLSPLTQTGLNTITLSRKKSTLGSYKDWYLRVVQLKASSDSNTPAYGFKEVFGYKNEGPCSTRVFHKTMGKGFGTVLVTFFSGS